MSAGETKMTFQVGDVVVCVDAGHTNLCRDHEYTISALDNGYVRLIGLGASGYYPDRFTLKENTLKRKLSGFGTFARKNL